MVAVGGTRASPVRDHQEDKSSGRSGSPGGEPLVENRWRRTAGGEPLEENLEEKGGVQLSGL
ncbi:hypothetical protein EYF80_062022 [Liparis tanakae]|uniref:Uncharacterized protein n=1 Tax=Liparis tanakae TaxID=230148 RepID=A0A4Z2EGQ0_9TELE|nr:hypothetical protein EYF80_062022 [Liparis tanakae]